MYIFIFWYHISVGKCFLFSQSLFYYHPWYPNGKMCWFLVHFVMAWFGTTSSSTTHNLSTSTSIAKSEVESMRMCFADRYENNINRTNDEILSLMYCTTSLETQWSDDFNTFFFFYLMHALFTGIFAKYCLCIEYSNISKMALLLRFICIPSKY